MLGLKTWYHLRTSFRDLDLDLDIDLDLGFLGLDGLSWVHNQILLFKVFPFVVNLNKFT